MLGEQSNKKNCFFFNIVRKGGGGGLVDSKISLSEKTEIFLDFFLQRGGVSPIPKGCYHKKMGILGYFCQKGGSYRFYQKKTQNISDFFAKRGGGLANSKISLSEKTRPFRIAERGGGSQNFGVFLKKNSFFFYASP